MNEPQNKKRGRPKILNKRKSFTLRLPEELLNFYKAKTIEQKESLSQVMVKALYEWRDISIDQNHKEHTMEHAIAITPTLADLFIDHFKSK